MTSERVPAEPPQLEQLEPTGHVELLDVLRGFALFGILFVNLTWFTGYAALPAAERATHSLDGLVARAIHVGFDGKFYSLFALLFGIGVALQAQRRAQRGHAFAPLFLRRTGWLFAFGAAHATLVWFGDILSLYALAALPLLAFLRRSRRTLLASAVALLAAPLALGLVWLAFPEATPAGSGYGPAGLVPAFGGESLAELFAANRAFLVERWALALESGRFLRLLGLFVLGVWIARSGLLVDPGRRRGLLPHVLGWGLVVGVPATLLETLRASHVAAHPPSPDGWIQLALGSLGTPALCLAYASAIALLFDREAWRRRLRVLAPAGRTSLSCYLGQSVAGVLVFYGVGLGLWGRVPVTWVPVLSVLAFGAQALASAVWLRRFRYGPAEWVWRSLTHGRPLPLRVGPRAERTRLRTAR